MSEEKVKRPYIQMFIGDTVRDWGHLSLEEFGAAHKLLYQIWNGDKGEIVRSYAACARTFGTTESEARLIIEALTAGINLGFKKEILADGKIKIMYKKHID